jgi:hypothetical protein
MRQNGSGPAIDGHRLGSATLAIIVSVVAVIVAVAFMAESIYALMSPVTGSDVVPRSLDDLRFFGLLSLVIAGFALATATSEELRARRREKGEAPESVSSASLRSASSQSKAV